MSPKRTRSLLPVAVALVLGALASAAAAQRIEITPFVGYRFGGELEGEIGGLRPDILTPDLEADDGESLGVVVDLALALGLQLEFLVERQETDLQVDLGLFSGAALTRLDIDYYHLGLVYQWPIGPVHPFVGGSLGITRFAPDLAGLDDATRPSGSLGGGVKIFISKNLGFRVEGRLFSTLIEDDDLAFCGPLGSCGRRNTGSYFEQSEIRAGLILAL